MSHAEIISTLQYAIDITIVPIWILALYALVAGVRLAWATFTTKGGE